VYRSRVKLKTLKRAPVFIATGVVALVCLIQLLRLEIFERLEWMTYDWRVKLAANHSAVIATNLGFVSISDATISDLSRGLAGSPYGLYWPRHVYGRVARELAEQGARTVAFDVLFGELRRDHPPILLAGGQEVESDAYFAELIHKSGNVILAADQGVIPPLLFQTNALALGDITADRDSDGVLRRALAFRTYRKWHPAFRTIESDPGYGIDLRKGRMEDGAILLPRNEGEPKVIRIPLTNGLFDVLDLLDRVPAGMKRFDKPFTDERIWHMGITLAAQQLKLDLTNAEVALDRGTITLHGPNGLTRVIPVDRRGYFYINWCLPINDRGQLLTQEPFEGLLAQYQMDHGHSNELADLRAGYWRNNVDWHGKLVVIGSLSVGNDLSDRGTTPLEKDTFLVSKHWNVANSVLTGQFIRRASLPVELLCIILMGTAAAVLTLVFRSYIGTFWVLVVSAAYVAAAWGLYLEYRYWVPLALPLIGGAAVTHAILLTYVVVFEQAERRRVRSVFTKMVSPDVVTEVLQSEKLSLDGARRNVTVYFADIRGFTEMTDLNMEKAAEFVKQNNLTGAAAEAVFDTQSRETLATVNLYLKIIAETVLEYNGTVDKFIGDCVMAFWGAPILNDKHALTCVRAAIAAQRAVHRLNLEREAENERREAENAKLAAEGRPLLHLLPVLAVGSGINTGVVTVGLMGSDERVNYTVFGRDVNLASRLESFSGRGRIIISEATLAEIIQDDPTLALACVELPAVNLKGFRTAIPVYEVPWREADSAAPAAPAASVSAPRARDAT
jgi:class 3 adenylate cyclase/CHASE2 domain-containing sensor protein